MLVVDHDPLILRVVATVLNAEAYEVSTVESAAEALAHLRSSPCDLVVCDVMMPGMDGFELCGRIRSDPDHAKLPVVLLTARDSDEDRCAPWRWSPT